MTDDEFEALLDEAIRLTGVARYRWLCSTANTLGGGNSRDERRRFIAGRRYVPAPGAVRVDYGDPPPRDPCCP
jgi:hypothetical protein